MSSGSGMRMARVAHDQSAASVEKLTNFKTFLADQAEKKNIPVSMDDSFPVIGEKCPETEGHDLEDPFDEEFWLRVRLLVINR